MIRLAVLGDPVAHSRSPAIHTAALAAAGIEGGYEARRVNGEGLRRACDEVRHGHLDGANITMPHKAEAALLADRLSPVGERSGSVNTWYRDAGRVVGTSTDGAGIIYALDQAGISADLPPLILGAGGAAAAALLALEERRPMIAARRPEAAHALVDRLAIEVEVVPWAQAMPDALVVNATPLGMAGESLPPGVVAGAAALLDMAYGSEPTPATVQARRRGIPVADGIAMLVGQAAASFELWTGIDPDRAVMAEAAAKTLKQP